MSGDSPPRRPLHERSKSDTNTQSLAAVRLVPATPPRLLAERDDVFSRTPLPTHPSHILLPGKGKAVGRGDAHALQYAFQRTSNAQESTGSSASTTHTTHQPSQYGESTTGSPISKPKPVPKKRLHIHKDNKTFSLVPQDDPQAVDDTPTSPTLSAKSSYSFLSSSVHNAGVQSDSITSCTSDATSTSPVPATPVPESKHTKTADPITNSPWNYQFVGGLRKVAKTPDLKQKAVTSDSPLPPLPETETSDTPDGPITTLHNLSTKLSFQSAGTATTTTTASENTNYKVYLDNSAPNSEIALAASASGDENYQLLGNPSPASSVIHRPQTEPSEYENYELVGDPSPSASYLNLQPPSKYSQESLVVPPLRPRFRRSNEQLGYYKSRSRESLRSGSLTSISTVLSQQEAARAIVGTGSLIQLPILASKLKGTNSWVKPFDNHPLRSPHMNETPHQWSSQLSTVPSVSEGGTDRGSRAVSGSWSDDNCRRSSGFPSTQSRHSRQVLSISSSGAQEEAGSRSRSESLEPPLSAFARPGQRKLSSSSFRMVEDQDEYGDGITDMQDLRPWQSRNRLSGFYSVSSDNGRTNTMRSTSSSRTNSLLASTLPTWARLYYGSGERRYLGLGAPGSSTEGTDSRTSSFRSGSPNTDQFPSNIHSPRRRPREVNAPGGYSSRGSMEITPAPQLGGDERLVHGRYSRPLRTWSMSSVWSPHLRLDRRATRHSVWDPPSLNWSTDGGWLGRRNVQIVMFITGFLFPFAWMVAALLPLPSNPMDELRECDNSTSNLEGSNEPNGYTRQFSPADEARYESAKWWRALNRWMSFVGLLIIAVVIILVVVGLKKGW